MICFVFVIMVIRVLFVFVLFIVVIIFGMKKCECFVVGKVFVEGFKVLGFLGLSLFVVDVKRVVVVDFCGKIFSFLDFRVLIF